MPALLHAQNEPIYFNAHPGSLAKAKQRIAAGDKELQKALNKLVEEANEELKQQPPSVVEKTKVPPSGDKHDYMSLAPYFWPNPNTKTGLPYIRHDGEVNPESRDENFGDNLRIARMGNAIDTLAFAYYFTGKEAYAAKAADFAKVWFLNPATKMNPNFKYAQAIPGVNSGRGTGILEGRHIATAADALQLLAGSPSWSAANDKAVRAWLDLYLFWLFTSEGGKDEHAAKNNHGSWFDVQTLELALSLNRPELARHIAGEVGWRRIAVQIQRDGKQPFELERTKSFGYSCFNLQALCELATMSHYAGVDLWHFKTLDGRGIKTALNFMTPYFDKPAKEWPYEQIKPTGESEYIAILRKASLAYNDPAYEKILEKYPDAGSKRFQLLFLK